MVEFGINKVLLVFCFAGIVSILILAGLAAARQAKADKAFIEKVNQRLK